MLAMKQIRERLGLTQTAVARELGVSRQTYNNWELGKRQADYEYLLRLGELFNTSVENILTGCLENAPPLTEQQAHLAELTEAGDPSPQVGMLMGLPEKEPNSSYKMNSRKENDTAESNSYKKSENKKEPPSKSAENGKTEKYLNISNMPVKEKEMLELFVRFLRWLDTQPDNPLANDSE